MTIFDNKSSAVSSFRSDYGQSVAAHINLAQVSDDMIYSKLISAEAYASRYLRVLLEPTIIVPDDASSDEIDILEAEGSKYIQEAAYDYDPDFFQGEKWGYIVTKQKPIISVESMKFAYPAPSSQIFEIPSSWIRLDKKFGHVRLVPAAMSFSAPLSAFIMQALGGGRTVPFMIQLRYTAGIVDVYTKYPDIVTTIKRLAVLNLLKDAMVPQSGSISADGLSQSMSIDLDKYQESIDQTLNTIRDEIHGIRFGVF